MSKKDNNRQSVRPDGTVMAPKAERREAGRVAKQRRLNAERRRRLAAQGGAALGVIAVVFGLIALNGGFDGKKTAASPGSTPSAGASAGANESPTASTPTDPALAAKPVVKAATTPLTKLVATPLVRGSGPAVQAGQEITVNYVGVFYKTGEEFDSSWKRSQPFTFTLGQGNVIAGWDQGLVGATVGSRIQLDIPADLAYGDSGEGGRPAGPLRFVVDVLSAN